MKPRTTRFLYAQEVVQSVTKTTLAAYSKENGNEHGCTFGGYLLAWLRTRARQGKPLETATVPSFRRTAVSKHRHNRFRFSGTVLDIKPITGSGETKEGEKVDDTGSGHEPSLRAALSGKQLRRALSAFLVPSVPDKKSKINHNFKEETSPPFCIAYKRPGEYRYAMIQQFHTIEPQDSSTPGGGRGSAAVQLHDMVST